MKLDNVATTFDFESERKRRERAHKAAMSKTLKHLPRHLEERRKEHMIPDVAFEFQASFDRVLVWQVAFKDEETFVAGGLIAKPQDRQHAEVKSSAMGILVSAGLSAMDALESNGYQLGDLVVYNQLHPYRLKLGRVGTPQDSVEAELIELRAGDMVANVDLAERLKQGRVHLEIEEVERGGARVLERRYRTAGCMDTFAPVDPWISDDT